MFSLFLLNHGQNLSIQIKPLLLYAFKKYYLFSTYSQSGFWVCVWNAVVLSFKWNLRTWQKFCMVLSNSYNFTNLEFWWFSFHCLLSELKDLRERSCGPLRVPVRSNGNWLVHIEPFLKTAFFFQVFNLNFHEVFSVSAEMHSVLCMVFNHSRDELITGGTGGMKVTGTCI